jgi:hypothetical protein
VRPHGAWYDRAVARTSNNGKQQQERVAVPIHEPVFDLIETPYDAARFGRRRSGSSPTTRAASLRRLVLDGSGEPRLPARRTRRK